ncbi:hypothetical protein EDD16DRAFT_1523942 [Pisolithus croceorrhizus]|nr:hypothetical protein EDD16DRAFT_1523942 [Pisolithus croceorrhizus]
MYGFWTNNLESNLDAADAATSRPAVTVAWTLAGLCVLQVWWGTWVRKWYFEQNAHGTSEEIKITRAKAKGVWFARLREVVGFTLLATAVTNIVIVLFRAPLVGAFPILLDWDRPWQVTAIVGGRTGAMFRPTFESRGELWELIEQAWPLTPLYGSLAGYIIASLAALAVNSLKWLAQEQLRSVQPSTKYKTS